MSTPPNIMRGLRPSRITSLPEAAHDGCSYKFATNCEYRLFQRPDDAIHPGLDRQTEADFARSGNFFSNFEPISPAKAQAMVDRVIEFDEFSQSMRDLLA